MTFTEYIVATMAYRLQYPSQRLGQAYMNVLHDVKPDLYWEVMEIEGDDGLWQINPFYTDKNINKFLAFVAERW